MSIAQWTGPLLQGIGVVTGSLALIDWALSERQKKTLRGSFESAWIWLNDHRVTHYYSWIGSTRAQRVIRNIAVGFSMFGLLCIAILVLEFVVERPRNETVDPFLAYTVGLYPSMAVYAIWVHPKLARRYLEGVSARTFGVRIGIVISLFSFLFVGFLIPDAPVGLIWGDDPLRALLIGVIIGPFFVFAIAFYMWLIWIVWLTGLAMVLRAAEFVMLRIASYDKGPVLGLSALLLGIGLIVKPLA